MQNKIITKENKNVKEFIQKTLIETIGAMIQTGNHYLGFGPQSQAIELIGAIIEDDTVEKLQKDPKSEFDTRNKSRRRFHSALKLFSNANYLKYCTEFTTDPNHLPDYDLYNNLRCGYAHQMKPLKKVSVTTLQESLVDGTSHLTISQDGKLMLVSEQLYIDLKEVCEKVCDMIDRNDINHTKPYGDFLQITSYHEKS